MPRHSIIQGKYVWCLQNTCHLFLLNITILLSLLSYAIPIIYGADLVVKNENSLLSVSANEAPLEAVFAKISKEFTIYVKVYPEMRQIRITEQFCKLPLREGIKKLAKENYALVEKENRIDSVFILNRGKDFVKRNTLLKNLIEDSFPSFEELKETVSRNVKEEHQNASIIAVFRHEDISGVLKSYAFCFYIGNGQPPTKRQIEEQVEKAWNSKMEARMIIEEGYKENNSSKMIKWLEKSKEYDHSLRRNSDFITLEISAHYDSPPIKSCYRGIVYDIAMYPSAVELLKENIGPEKAFSYCRTFSFNPLAIGFEFKDTDNQNYYVDVLNKSVFTKFRERNLKKNRIINQDTKKRIFDQWVEFLGL